MYIIYGMTSFLLELSTIFRTRVRDQGWSQVTLSHDHVPGWKIE